jgi:hypothetical protein
MLLAIWGAFISTILLIFKIIESKKHLDLIIVSKKISYETEKGDQTIKVLQVKILNKTNYNTSIQNIIIIAYRYYFILPFNCSIIPFIAEEEIGMPLLKPGEFKIFNYNMTFIHPDGDLNIDLIKSNKLKNHYIRAKVIYPDNSVTHSKNGIRINSILRK